MMQPPGANQGAAVPQHHYSEGRDAVAEKPASMLDAALEWYAAGMSVIPILPNGKKKPAVRWTEFQHKRADEEQIRRWWTANPDYGIGVICGAVSGGLEMLELEGRCRDEVHLAKLREVLVQRYANGDDLLAVWSTILGGFTEDTPSGGMHVFYRLVEEPVPGNTKIARRPATEAELQENPLDRTKVLAETRGEGGYVIVAPTSGLCHPLGEPWGWSFNCGTPDTIETLTWEERQELVSSVHDALDELDSFEPVTVAEPRHDPLPPRTNDSRLRPGDDYNLRASWSDLLIPQGWTVSHVIGSVTYWTRPGKDSRDGASATTGRRDGEQDCLYVFSSSTDLPMETPLTKLYVFAHYFHGGDLSGAAAELGRQGYGDPIVDDDWMSRLPLAQSSTTTTNTETLTPPGVDVNSVVESEPTRRLVLTPASAYPIQRVRWLWEDRAPIGEITIIAGREGVGKSVLLARLAADITHGRLSGEFFGTPRPILYATAEDSWSHTVAPRMLAAGADMDMVFHIHVETVEIGKSVLALPTDCKQVALIAKEIGAGALMLDPAISMVSTKLDVNQSSSLRQALEPLRRAGEEADMAILALSHFNKINGTDVSSKVAGSRAWMEVARAAWAVARVPHDTEDEEEQETDSLLSSMPNNVVLSQIKSNLGRMDLPNLMYEIISGTIPDENGVPISVGRIEWRENSALSAPEILDAMPGPKGGPNAKTKVIKFVKDSWRSNGMVVCYSEMYEALEDFPQGTIRSAVHSAVREGLLYSRRRGEFQPAGTQKED